MTRAPITRGDIAALTQARLTLGPRRAAPDTQTSLRFALDYAQARQAVTSDLDVAACVQALRTAGFTHDTILSGAESRATHIRRPDLGRQLPPAEAARLGSLGPCDVAFVLGDGLSAVAAQLNGPAFLSALRDRLQALGLSIGPVIIARHARVALGDGIAQALGASTVVMALGERPGLSAADSLGVYITQNPVPGTPDSARNCISNVREAGLSVAQAAQDAAHLIAAMRKLGQSGVALSQSLGQADRLE